MPHFIFHTMLRISKLTDYALVILSYMKEGDVLSAAVISEHTHIPLATTNKVLKLLLAQQICQSRSGKMGGFILAKKKSDISLLSVVHAIEGQQTSLTQCSNSTASQNGSSLCQLKKHCRINEKMNLIDQEINLILSQRFISDLS